jgi:DNA polymerase-3 subunit alpha
MDDIQSMIESNNQKYPVKNCTLRFMVKDMEESILIELPSKTYKVNPSDDLMAEIQSLTNVEPMLK